MPSNILRHFKSKLKSTDEKFPLFNMAKNKDTRNKGKVKRDKNSPSPKATSPSPSVSNTPTPPPSLLPISETPSRPGASNIRAAAPLWDSVDFKLSLIHI